MDPVKNFFKTLSDYFIIGKTGPRLKNNGGVLEVKDTADSVLATVRVAKIGTSPNNSDAPSLLDLRARVPAIQFSFAGASAPSAGVNTNKFGFCHTTGGSYTANDVVFDDGTTLNKIPATYCLHITTSSAVSGTVSLIANGFYALESGSYVLKGDGTSTSSGIIQVIEISYVYTDTTKDSTTSIPNGARVVRVENRVDVAFNNGSPTIAVVVNGGTPLTILATTESDQKTAAQYENLGVVDVGASNAGVVRYCNSRFR